MPTNQPVLTTSRLQLLPAAGGWARAVLAYQQRNRAHFAPWEPTPGGMFYTELFWVMRLRQRELDWQENSGAMFLLVQEQAPQQVIGTVTLSGMTRGVFQACYLGYSLDQAYEGQGLMREALEAVIAFAFGSLKLHRLQANYQPENERSAGLLKRLGFQVEGQARDYLFLNGAWRDHVLTSLIHADYDAAPLLA